MKEQKSKKPKSKRRNQIEWIISIILVLLMVKCALPNQEDLQRATSLRKITEDYISSIEMRQNWESVNILDSSDHRGVSVAINYSGSPSIRTAMTDTTLLNRQILKKLTESGFSPALDNIRISVFAFGQRRGETGLAISISYGRSRYVPYKDTIEYIERD